MAATGVQRQRDMDMTRRGGPENGSDAGPWSLLIIFLGHPTYKPC